MKPGLAVLAMALALFGALALRPAPAEAQPGGGTPPTTVLCTVTTPDGVVAETTCQVVVTSFTVVNGVLTAVGTITPAGGQPLPFTTPVLDVTGTCEILSLVLGPIDLNLLGLRVETNQIELDITAVTGSGNLLGNLLCAVTRLLDSNASTNALARLLNQILGALG